MRWIDSYGARHWDYFPLIRLCITQKGGLSSLQVGKYPLRFCAHWRR